MRSHYLAWGRLDRHEGRPQNPLAMTSVWWRYYLLGYRG